MSNLISKMQNRNKRIPKHEAKKLMNNQPNKMSIDFSDRILPTSILIDVKTSTMKIGNGTQKLRDVIATYQIKDDIDSLNEFVAKIEALQEQGYKQVIMDNKENFKIKLIEEFLYDVKSQMHIQFNTPLPEKPASMVADAAEVMVAERIELTFDENDIVSAEEIARVTSTDTIQ